MRLEPTVMAVAERKRLLGNNWRAYRHVMAAGNPKRAAAYRENIRWYVRWIRQG